MSLFGLPQFRGERSDRLSEPTSERKTGKGKNKKEHHVAHKALEKSGESWATKTSKLFKTISPKKPDSQSQKMERARSHSLPMAKKEVPQSAEEIKPMEPEIAEELPKEKSLEQIKENFGSYRTLMKEGKKIFIENGFLREARTDEKPATENEIFQQLSKDREEMVSYPDDELEKSIDDDTHDMIHIMWQEADGRAKAEKSAEKHQKAIEIEKEKAAAKAKSPQEGDKNIYRGEIKTKPLKDVWLANAVFPKRKETVQKESSNAAHGITDEKAAWLADPNFLSRRLTGDAKRKSTESAVTVPPQMAISTNDKKALRQERTQQIYDALQAVKKEGGELVIIDKKNPSRIINAMTDDFLYDQNITISHDKRENPARGKAAGQLIYAMGQEILAGEEMRQTRAKQISEAQKAAQKKGHELVLIDKNDPTRKINLEKDDVLYDQNIVISHAKKVDPERAEVTRQFIDAMRPEIYAHEAEIFTKNLNGYEITSWGKQTDVASINESWGDKQPYPRESYTMSPFNHMFKQLEFQADPTATDLPPPLHYESLDVKLKQLKEVMAFINNNKGHELYLMDVRQPKKRIVNLTADMLSDPYIQFRSRRTKIDFSKAQTHKQRPRAAGEFIYRYLAPEAARSGETDTFLKAMAGWKDTPWGKDVQATAKRDHWDSATEATDNDPLTERMNKMQEELTAPVPQEEVPGLSYGSLSQEERIDLILGKQKGGTDLAALVTIDDDKQLMQDLKSAYTSTSLETDTKRKNKQQLKFLAFAKVIAEKYRNERDLIPRDLNHFLETTAQEIYQQNPKANDAVGVLKGELNTTHAVIEDILDGSAKVEKMPQNIFILGEKGVLQLAFNAAITDANLKKERLSNLLKFVDNLHAKARDDLKAELENFKNKIKAWLQ